MFFVSGCPHGSVNRGPMEIPYSTEPRPDTGATNAQIGMWLFLGSEVMLFGALFSAYALLRMDADNWPVPGTYTDVRLGGVNTLVLIGSTIAAFAATRAAQAGERARAARLVLLTTLAGLIFLGIKSFEWHAKMEHGVVPGTNMFLALYFTMTGLHAFHVLAGLIAYFWWLGPGAGIGRREPARDAQRLRVTGYYWAFVDVIWLLMFPIFYLF